MHHQLFLLVPIVLTVGRALPFARAIGSRPAMSAETEYEALVLATITLTMLLVVSTLMIRFPEVGAVIATSAQF